MKLFTFLLCGVFFFGDALHIEFEENGKGVVYHGDAINVPSGTLCDAFGRIDVGLGYIEMDAAAVSGTYPFGDLPWTIAFWANISNSTTEMAAEYFTLFRFGGTTPVGKASPGFSLRYYKATGKLALQLWIDGVDTVVKSNTPVSLGEWSHIVIERYKGYPLADRLTVYVEEVSVIEYLHVESIELADITVLFGSLNPIGAGVPGPPPVSVGMVLEVDDFVVHENLVAFDALGSCIMKYATPSATLTFTPSVTESVSPTFTTTASDTLSGTPTFSLSATASVTLSESVTATIDFNVSLTETDTPTFTMTRPVLMGFRCLEAWQVLVLNIVCLVLALPLTSEQCSHSLICASKLLFVAVINGYPMVGEWSDLALSHNIAGLETPGQMSGCTLGSFIVLAVVTAVVYIAHHVVSGREATDRWDEHHYLAHAPSSLISAFSFLYPVLCYTSLYSLVFESYGATSIAALVAVLLCFFIPIKLWRKGHSSQRCGKIKYVDLRIKHPSARSRLEHYLIGSGEWVMSTPETRYDAYDEDSVSAISDKETAKRNTRVLEYAALLRGRSPGFGVTCGALLDFIVMGGFAVCMIVVSEDPSWPRSAMCYGVMAFLVLTCNLLPSVVISPFTSLKDIFFCAVEALLMSCGFCMMCAGYVQGEDLDHVFFVAAGYLFSALFYVVLCAFVFDVLAVFLTYQSERRYRLQIAENSAESKDSDPSEELQEQLLGTLERRDSDLLGSERNRLSSYLHVSASVQSNSNVGGVSLPPTTLCTNFTATPGAGTMFTAETSFTGTMEPMVEPTPVAQTLLGSSHRQLHAVFVSGVDDDSSSSSSSSSSGDALVFTAIPSYGRLHTPISSRGGPGGGGPACLRNSMMFPLLGSSVMTNSIHL